MIFFLIVFILFAIILISFSIILYKYKTMNLPLIYTLKVKGLLTFIYLHLRSSGYYIKWTTKCVTCKLLKICNSHSFYLTRLKYTQFIESMSAYNSCNLKKKRKKVTTFQNAWCSYFYIKMKVEFNYTYNVIILILFLDVLVVVCFVLSLLGLFLNWSKFTLHWDHRLHKLSQAAELWLPSSLCCNGKLFMNDQLVVGFFNGGSTKMIIYIYLFLFQIIDLMIQWFSDRSRCKWKR